MPRATSSPGRVGEQLARLLQRQLVGRQVVGHVGPLADRVALVVGAFQVGPVTTDPQHDAAVRAADRERRELLGVDVAELGDQGVQPGHGVGAVVELLQLADAVGLTRGDLVEDVLHLRGELVVDLPGEVLLQQPDDGERDPGRHQRRALLVDVPAVDDRADDRGVRRRAADLAVLELLDQRGLGVARRRLGLVALGRQRGGVHGLALGQLGQRHLVVVAALAALGALDVRLEEPVEGDDSAGRGEDHVAAVGGLAADADRDRLAGRVLHLRGDRALPDQLVEAELVAGQPGLAGRAEGVAGRADRLVRLLGVLDLGGVGARRVGQVLRPVELADLVARRRDRGLRQRGRVGAHVGDVAALVEPLGDRHRHRRAHAELAARLLLEGGGAERRVRRAAVGLRLHRPDGVRRVVQRLDQALGAGAVEVDPVLLALQLAVRPEVGAAGDARLVDRVQPRREHARAPCPRRRRRCPRCPSTTRRGT